jgi:HEPN domain-containing protein
MGEISLYSRALSDFNAGRILLNHLDTDENIIDIVGYHLQQSVEKLLKFQIEMQGDVFPFTHDISVLMDFVDNIPEWLREHSETLMKYGVKTRYSSLRIASKKIVLQLYDYHEKYLESVKPKNQADIDAMPKIG